MIGLAAPVAAAGKADPPGTANGSATTSTGPSLGNAAGSNGPTVLPTTVERPTEVLGVQLTRTPPAALARTGTEILPLVYVGGLSLVVGLLLLSAAMTPVRRRMG